MSPFKKRLLGWLVAGFLGIVGAIYKVDLSDQQAAIAHQLEENIMLKSNGVGFVVNPSDAGPQP